MLVCAGNQGVRETGAATYPGNWGCCCVICVCKLEHNGHSALWREAVAACRTGSRMQPFVGLPEMQIVDGSFYSVLPGFTRQSCRTLSLLIQQGHYLLQDVAGK